MELALSVLGLLTALVGAWVLWVRMRAKTPLELANEELEIRGRAKERIRLDIQRRNTNALERTRERQHRELAALKLRRKAHKAD